MTGYLNQILAEQHVNDLIAAAEHDRSRHALGHDHHWSRLAAHAAAALHHGRAELHSSVTRAVTLPVLFVLDRTGNRSMRWLDWRMSLSLSNATRLMNSLGSVLPDSWWRRPTFLAVMSRLVPPILHTGKLRLAGVAPNGQRFIVNPSLTWLIADTAATLDGLDLGDVGAAPTPGKLGDFRIPQRGIFAIGRAFFEHVAADGTTRS
jgi:hypothetical protein